MCAFTWAGNHSNRRLSSTSGKYQLLNTNSLLSNNVIADLDRVQNIWAESRNALSGKWVQEKKTESLAHRLLINDWDSSPVYGGDAGDGVVITDAIRQQPVPDLPGEHGGILAFIVRYFIHHLRRGHFRFGSSDDSRLYASSLIISAETRANLIFITWPNLMTIHNRCVLTKPWKCFI